MIPAAFHHDRDSNRLSLKADMTTPPWIRPHHGRQKEGVNTWLYCCDCKAKHVQESSATVKL
eukprot:5941124-Karenia_brevis.AAC.1